MAFDKYTDVIDSRQVIERIEELRTYIQCANCGEDVRQDDNGAGGLVWVHLFGSTVCYDDPPGSIQDGTTTTTAEALGLDADELAELSALESLAEDASGSPDWEYGETLVRDSYFKDYAQELAEDTSDIDFSKLQWPLTCIDWEQAARELKYDYFSVDFDGVEYWIRS